jgi:hypothetical protein
MATKKVLVGVDDEVWRRVKMHPGQEAFHAPAGGTVVSPGAYPNRVQTAGVPKTAREVAQQIAERQAWLRDHPEDEQQ